MSHKKLLLGDEAIGLGALYAGISGVYAYPGTPSTEITEYIQAHPLAKERNIHRDWCSNEKTAMEAALGMSYAGKRALVCMKHVGMNVCADGFVNSAVTGANGGLVVTACDDPSQHSSQNEQDSRFYADFAMMPCFEPSNQQEAFKMVQEAFDYSEKRHIPVLMRLTTRMAHSRAVVDEGEELPREENERHYPDKEHEKFWVTLPAIARGRIRQLAQDQELFTEDSDESPFNVLKDGVDTSFGIITCGIAYNYLMENFPNGCPYPVLKVTRYPFPTALLRKLVAKCKTILVIEEGQPLVEQRLRGLLYDGSNLVVKGRLDGTLPRTGELNPDLVRKGLGLKVKEIYSKSETAVPRPPALCQGCGHRDFYSALNLAVKKYGTEARIFGDIGCYTLGYMSPLNAIHTCVEMGASLTMAVGAADAGAWPSIAVIGDSTFTHSGMTGLLDAVNSKSDIVLCISDNLTTGMTGGQDSAGTGKLEDICKGIGVEPEHIRTIVPLPKNYPDMERVIEEEIAYHGVSVIISRRECIQTAKRHASAARTAAPANADNTKLK
ncbi:MAG: thiamine pyrophosphate-dependent enzyme [Bacteroidales bacterium]|nr:thiamine pyrophosphate-dependent enzyme [Bacteroidales bacterium]MDY6001989.1 thiamine pyrophosphate-dependent enzyme [Candidatus Cryptobacteroides sp.]